jgi:hypothetical protein
MAGATGSFLVLVVLLGVAVSQRRVARSHLRPGTWRAMAERQELVGETKGEEGEGIVQFHPLQYGMEMMGEDLEGRSYTPHSGCEIKHETVTVVKQVPSFTKHCQKVEDTKCKTVFKNAFTTQIETQCTATFETSCDSTLETAYKQQCKTIVDVECRIINIEKDGQHESKKICEDVPTEKCIPVPVKVEGQKCVNVPTQMCENVPVTVAQEVPHQQCYKKPRKVCQTLVGTKPKVVTAQIPREVCGHASPAHGRVKPPPVTSSGFPGLPPSFRPPAKGVESQKESFLGEVRPTSGGGYDYDGEEEEGFNYPRGHPAPKPNTEGFNDNLLQFLKKNN